MCSLFGIMWSMRLPSRRESTHHVASSRCLSRLRGVGALLLFLASLPLLLGFPLFFHFSSALFDRVLIFRHATFQSSRVFRPPRGIASTTALSRIHHKTRRPVTRPSNSPKFPTSAQSLLRLPPPHVGVQKSSGSGCQPPIPGAFPAARKGLVKSRSRKKEDVRVSGTESQQSSGGHHPI